MNLEMVLPEYQVGHRSHVGKGPRQEVQVTPCLGPYAFYFEVLGKRPLYCCLLFSVREKLQSSGTILSLVSVTKLSLVSDTKMKSVSDTNPKPVRVPNLGTSWDNQHCQNYSSYLTQIIFTPIF